MRILANLFEFFSKNAKRKRSEPPNFASLRFAFFRINANSQCEFGPLFELKSGHQEIFFPDFVRGYEPADKMRRPFSRMALFNLQERKNLFTYERIVFLRPDTILHSLKYLQREMEEYVEFRKFLL